MMGSTTKKIWQWLNERWPLTTFFRLSLEEDIPGGASYAYTLGSATLVIFLLQVISGVWQLFYYVPTVDHAYNSLNYFRISVSLGWLIHGIHYWGAQAMVVLVTIHMLRVFIWGAYKNPRQLTWIAGVVLLLLTMALSFTGALLPWDEKGYYAAEVGTSIMGTVPYVGEWLKQFARGGAAMGQLTLSRFFILHVAILPALLIGFLAFHLVAFRQFGSVGPWIEEKRRKIGAFWPDQVFKDALVGIFLLVAIIALIVLWRPPITGAAGVVDTSYQPKPEWDFLFLYQAVKIFKGAWEPVGTVGLPLVAVLLLFLVPFLDRHKERRPKHRPIAMLAMSGATAAVIALTIFGYYSHPGASSSSTAKTSSATNKSAPAKPAVQLTAAAKQGKLLFHSQGCIGCHTIDGSGGTVGPNLSNEANRGHTHDWLVSQIRNPRIHAPKTVMPAFKNLTDQQVNELVAYLSTLGAVGNSSGDTSATKNSGVPGGSAIPAQSTAADSSAAVSTTAQGQKSEAPLVIPKGPPGPAAYIIGNPPHGEELFKRNCESCHGLHGTGNVPNPGSASGVVPALNPINPKLKNQNPEIFAENIDRFIQHGATPAGPNPAIKMPDFGDSHTLTQQEISEVEAYILSINHVNRAKLQNPGIEPKTFLLITLIVFGVVLIGFAVLRRLFFTGH